MASSTATSNPGFFSTFSSLNRRSKPFPLINPQICSGKIFSSFSLSTTSFKLQKNPRKIVCQATEVSVAEESPVSGNGDGRNWIPVVPLAALPKGERRVIIQDDETILLLWYKDEVFAIENRSPAEGAYSEGLINAKLTQVRIFLIFLFLFLWYLQSCKKIFSSGTKNLINEYLNKIH